MSKTKDNKTGKGMVLTERDGRVIADIAKFSVLTRDQLCRLNHFKSKSRANALLLRLSRAGFITRRFQPILAGTRRSVFFLGLGGAGLLGYSRAEAERVVRRGSLASLLFLDHQLLVNDLRLGFQTGPTGYEIVRWHDESALREFRLGVLPDGCIEYELSGKHFTAFVEADRGTETLDRIRQKAQAYLRLATSGDFERTFRRRFFRVLVVSPSQRRIDNLRRAIRPVTDRIFWFAVAQQVRQLGAFAPIWLRPNADSLHSLTES